VLNSESAIVTVRLLCNGKQVYEVTTTATSEYVLCSLLMTYRCVDQS
jgi:hypothetical protein